MIVCKKCEAKSQPSANFCAQCGEKLNPKAASPAQKSEAKADDRLKLMPAAMRERYLKAQENIEGSRKMVSVIFADINGFTALCEQHDPEAVHDLINKYFKRLGQVVYEFEGYIDKFIGDCIMALFGAPIAHENDPELAIRCAIKMIEELKSINRENNLNLSMSIGINAGMVVAGGMGTDLKFDFTVIGDAVNIAQRLEASAGKNKILVGRSVYKVCEKLFDFETLAPTRLKGKQDLIEVYSVNGFKKRKFAERGVGDGVAKLVGRVEEVSRFNDALHQLAQQSSVLMISGDAGSGKSRLKFEWRRLAQSQKISWHESKGTELRKDVPYYPFIGLLNSIFKINSDVELELQKGSLKALDSFKLAPSSKELILDLLQLSAEKEQPESSLHPSDKKRALFLSIKKLFLELSKAGRVILFIDDLHWVDPLSIELLVYLMDGLPPRGLLLSGTYRTEFSPAWQKKPHFQELKLKALSKTEAVELVIDLLGLKSVPPVLEKSVSESSEGNPLYVLEIVKTMIDSGQITKVNDEWVVSEKIESLQVSPTLQGLVAARIDRLYQSDKEILQVASVIGRQFSDHLLAKVIEVGDNLYDSLQFLRKRELIFEVSAQTTHTDYVFNHMLTQQVAYQSILQKKRKLIHQKVAEAIEALVEEGTFGKLEEHLSELTFHYVESGVPDKALLYLKKTAKLFANQFNHLAAIRNYKGAIEILEKLSSENREKQDRDLFELHFELVETYFLIADYLNAEKTLERLLALAEKLTDSSLLARVYRRLGDNERARGDSEKALYLLQLALGHSQKAKDSEMEARIYKSLGGAVQKAGKWQEALDYFGKGLTAARNLRLVELISEFLNDMGATFIQVRDLPSAEKALEESQKISRIKNKRTFLSATINLGVIYFMKNDLPKAMTKLREASQEAQAMGDLSNAMTCEHNLGVAAIQVKNLDEALKSFEYSFNLAQELGNHLERLNNQIFVGYVKALRDAKGDGQKLLEDGIEDAKTRAYSVIFCEGKFLLAQILAAKGEHQSAKTHLSLALQKAKEIQNPVIQEKCRLELEKISAA